MPMPVPDSGPYMAEQTCQGHLSLAAALDRILQRGVSVQGNLTIGLADVDLLYLDLRLLLGSVDAIWPDGRSSLPPVSPKLPESPASPSSSLALAESTVQPEIGSPDSANRNCNGNLPIAPNERRGADGSSTAQGLVRLVLTLVKLLHDVLERQAVHRMEAGRLTDTQIEDVGTALCVQAQEILHLQRQFGFSDKDLSLGLGVPGGAL
jgi:hypothetical protein